VTKMLAKARTAVPVDAMNPAQMILRAQLAIGPDRADHGHGGQPSRRVAPRPHISRRMPRTARNQASPNGIVNLRHPQNPQPRQQVPDNQTVCGGGGCRRPAQNTVPAGSSTDVTILPKEVRRYRRIGLRHEYRRAVGTRTIRTILVQARAQLTG